jgi:hypothetical protein
MPRYSFGSHPGAIRRKRYVRSASVGLTALALLGATHAGPAYAQFGAGNGTPLPAPSAGHAQVLTYHNNNMRTGVNPFEIVLTPAVVKQGFGKLFQHVVDGSIYGQPLFVSDLTIRNIYSQKQTTHKGVVFVTTSNNSIYAFDADNNTGANSGPLWFLNFNFIAQNIAPVPGNAIIDLFGAAQTDIQPVIGIIGTPVIDASTSTMYVLVRTQENNDYVHRLHAIDITTGLERNNSPVNVYDSITNNAPSVPGNGDGADGNGNVIFDPLFENQRPALLLSKGIVYISYGGTENIAPYHGWMLGYDTTTLTLVRILNTTPNASFPYVPGADPVGGGFDMSGAGPATDAFGNIYASTGVGQFDANAPTGSNSEYGESILRLSPTDLTVSDYFTPYNYQTLNDTGMDLGAGGVVVLPDGLGVTGHPHLLVAGGGEGKLYLLDRDNLGKVGVTTDSGAVYSRRNSVGEMFGIPALFNGELYYHAAGDVLRAFTVNKTYPYLTDLTPAIPTTPIYDFPGAIPSISASGTTNGIVWEIEPFHPIIPNGNQANNQTTNPIAVLRAYDATAPGKVLWSSNDAGGRDTGPNYVKFSVPTVANGKVFVPGDGVLTTYGSTPTPAPATGVHYVLSGPVFAPGLADGGTIAFLGVPTLTPNVKYDFSVTAVGADGMPLKLNQTVQVSLEDDPLTGGTIKVPLTSVTFNNSANATFTTYIPYAGLPIGAVNMVLRDGAGNSSFAAIQTGGQSLSGFDHYVLRAPLTVRNGQLSTILVTAATSTGVPVLLPGDLVAVYDTLPGGIQPYDADANDPTASSWGLLPDDGDGFLATGQVPLATATTHFAYEFQWGAGDYDVVPAFEGDTSQGFPLPGGQLTAGIPIQLHGIGKHVIIMTNNLLLQPVSATEANWINTTSTATAIINVIP